MPASYARLSQSRRLLLRCGRNALLKLAAERYLETEDCAARAAIRASYPKDVKVLELAVVFQPGNAERQGDAYLEEVFRSVELNDLYGSCPYSHNRDANKKRNELLSMRSKKI